MKSCPLCKNSYEDWIEFCFNDGSPLVVVQAPAPESPVAAPPVVPPPAPPVVEPPPPPAVDVPEPPAVDASKYAAFDAFDAPEPTMIRMQKAAAAAAAPTPVTAAPRREYDALDAPSSPGLARPPEPTRVDTAPALALEAPIAVAPSAAPEPVLEAAPEPAPVPTVAKVNRTFAPAAETVRVTPERPVERAAPLPERPAAAPEPAPFAPPVVAAPVAKDDDLDFPSAPSAPSTPSALDADEASEAPRGTPLLIAGVVAIGALVAVLAAGAWWFSQRADVDPVAKTPTPPAPVEAPAPMPTAAPAPVEPAPTEPPPADVPAPAPEEPIADAALPETPETPKTPEQLRLEAEKKAEEAKKKEEAKKAEELRKAEEAKKAATAAVTPTTSTADPWGAPQAASRGTLSVSSDPPGATITVDGVSRGAAPVRVELAYGSHSVKASMQGYSDTTKEVNLASEQMSLPMRLPARMASGSINLYGPPGGRVWLDNFDLGTLPVTSTVAEGVRNFRLQMPDGRTCNFAREIRFSTPGRPVTVRLEECP